MRPSAQRLNRFEDSVREKKDWYFQILDKKPEPEPGKQWAREAGLLPSYLFNLMEYDEWNPPDPADFADVYALLANLKNEAKRIVDEDYTIHISNRKLPLRPDLDFEQIAEDVKREINFMQNSAHAIRAPWKLKEQVGVYASNGLVPVSLHAELVKELDRLASFGIPDYQPQTGCKVQDLIHPSLYAFAPGVTPPDPSANIPYHPTEFTTKLKFNGADKMHKLTSKYAWLPSIFKVSADEKDCRIESYINGLGPREDFPVLYRLLELTFLLVLPHLKRSVSNQFEFRDSESVTRWREREPYRQQPVRKEVWEELLKKQWDEQKQRNAEKKEEELRKVEQVKQDREDPRMFQQSAEPVPGSAKEKEYKVIVKAVDHVLRSNESYSGNWHLDGMPHERIIASALYYYDAGPNIVDTGLMLRRHVDLLRDKIWESARVSLVRTVPVPKKPKKRRGKKTAQTKEQDSDKETEERIEIESDYPSDSQEAEYARHYWEEYDHEVSPNIHIGTVPTHKEPQHNGTGRIVSIPNWIQQGDFGLKFDPPVDSKGLRPIGWNNCLAQKRRILCFFLVDDEGPYEFPTFSIANDSPEKRRVFSTREIPSQKQECNIPTLRILLRIACRRYTGQELPEELCEIIFSSTDFGVTREKAEMHRRALIEERASEKMNTFIESGSYALREW